MKKVCFVVSHLGSGSSSLVASLNANPRCEIRESAARYESSASVRWLFKLGHKCRDAGAVYGDHLLFNSSLANRDLYGGFLYIFVVRPARHSLNEILKMGYGEREASSYYRFRLRRVCEIAKKSPGSVLLTWDDLAKEPSLRIIEGYLGLSERLHPPSLNQGDGVLCSERTVGECQEAYDRYYQYLNGLELRRTRDKAD